MDDFLLTSFQIELSEYLETALSRVPEYASSGYVAFSGAFSVWGRERFVHRATRPPSGLVILQLIFLVFSFLLFLLESSRWTNNHHHLFRTMARLSSVLLLSMVGAGAAFTPVSNIAVRTPAPSVTELQESFGFDFAEDPFENTPKVILGEANYKQYVAEKTPNSFLNRQVGVFSYFLLEQIETKQK